MGAFSKIASPSATLSALIACWSRPSTKSNLSKGIKYFPFIDSLLCLNALPRPTAHNLSRAVYRVLTESHLPEQVRKLPLNSIGNRSRFRPRSSHRRQPGRPDNHQKTLMHNILRYS